LPLLFITWLTSFDLWRVLKKHSPTMARGLDVKVGLEPATGSAKSIAEIGADWSAVGKFAKPASNPE